MNELKELRKETGTTQLQLAKLLGLKTASAYYKKENGQSQITLSEAKVLADYFHKPIEFFCH